jgi:hypothetical protein
MSDVSKILEYEINFRIDKFKNEIDESSKTLSVEDIDCNIWYENFVQLLVNKINSKTYFPICRFSDGEYLFIFDEPFPKLSFNIFHFILEFSKFIKSRILNFKAGMSGIYQSGSYNIQEKKLIRNLYYSKIKYLSEKGIIALHLSYGEVKFQEKYFDSLKINFEKKNIVINKNNYFPFYFVYAAFSCDDVLKILDKRSVLIVTSAYEQKKNSVNKSLFKLGVKDIFWTDISKDRSIYDKINITEFVGKVDIVLIAAGIGKVFLFDQLEELNVPCIDIGFIIEVWNNPENGHKRPLCNNKLL